MEDINVVKIDGKLSPNSIQVHLYNVQNVLHPRGSMKKESIGSTISDNLVYAFESWTDPKYGDKPNVTDLINHLHNNLVNETNNAWINFAEKIVSGVNETDEILLKVSMISATKPKYDSEYVNNFIERILSKRKLFTTYMNFVSKFANVSNGTSIYINSFHIHFLKTNTKYNHIYGSII